MAFTPAPVRDPFDKDLRASRSWVAWFAEVQQTITNIVAGSVTSVGLALPSQFTVSGSPVTGAGVLAGSWKNQSANTFLGGPASGPNAAPDFRALTTADIPALAYDPVGSAATVQINLTAHTGLTGTAVHGLGDWSVTNYPTWTSGTPFVKMTAAGVFALDTSTYLTSLSGAVLTDQTVGQTIGVTAHRLTKLWATDLDVTNAIAGSVTGNAGTVTNGLYTTGLGTVTQAYSVKLAGLSGLTDAAGWYHSNGSGTYAWSTPTKSDVGLGSVENTALSTWAGTTNITTLGTVTTAGNVALLNGTTAFTAAQTIDKGSTGNHLTVGHTKKLIFFDDGSNPYLTDAANGAGSGIAGNGAGGVYLISGGSSAGLFTASVATLPGSLTIAGTKAVTYGANDSGGTGYKVLRVAN